MNVIEILGECCTFDSAYIRGWKWLFPARYRDELCARYTEHHRALVTLCILEVTLFMLVEIGAQVFLGRRLFTL